MFLCTTSMCCENNLREENRIEITKKGQWNNGNSRSGEDIVAFHNNSYITMRYNVNLGQVEVSIENEYGNIVHNSYFHANESEVSFIPIGNLPSGTYLITINYNDGYAEGEFRIMK